MAPLDLDGGTLGERHQHYNKLLKEAIANSQPVSDLKWDDNDIENLMKIDLASHNRDVDYIIRVLKCGDMLCVSRALTQATWLVTDQQYANIINPDYLHTQLRPYMSTKAFIKLYKNIRHNIQDEARAELFYLHEEKPTDAVKWLPRCSVAFIENNVKKHVHDLKITTFKQLCERSISIFEIIYININHYERGRFAQAAMFFLKANVDKFLDILEKENTWHNYPKFNVKTTNIIMKKSPKRIIDKFAVYANFLDIPTFSKYLKPDEVKDFLYKLAKTEFPTHRGMQNFFKYNTLKHFIKRLPQSEQFEFAKKIFIDKEIAEAVEDNLTPGTELYDMKKLHKLVNTPSYEWYHLAPFERAFEDITTILSKDMSNTNRLPMLNVLLSCADHNPQYIQTVLEYYLDKHKGEDFYMTANFCIGVIENTKIYQYDEKTWNLLNEIFKRMKIYEERKDIVLFIDTIIVYHLIHDLGVPKTIEEQFSFKTLKSYETKLNKEQKEKVFRFLYETLSRKLKESILKEEDLTDTINVLESILQLLHDWKKHISDYPNVLDKIKQCAKVRKDNSWKTSLVSLYNFNKSWRIHMFEESVTIKPCEEVCLNALKHDPQLLERHSNEILTLQTNDAVSLRRLINKLRVYWPNSLAQNWTDVYFQNLKKTEGHKATLRGLCAALPQKPLLQLIDQYKPAQPKIDWNKVDDKVLSIQRFLAKNMHIARPQPGPDCILLYAKGDYLQFALPSVLAIFYNLSKTQSQEHIPKLLDAPVSLQKHGIRLAFRKLDRDALKKIFFDCWKASKNASIRAIIFTFTFELLCNEQDPTKIVDFWELIELFIDNLTLEEDKKIYELISQVGRVPRDVRANYLVKSHKFMKTLSQKGKESDREHYEDLSRQMASHARDLMEVICPEFVTAIIQEFIDKEIFGSGPGTVYYSGGMTSVLTAYLLCAHDEITQMQKYEQVFVPIMKRSLSKWGENQNGRYVVRNNFVELLSRLATDLHQYTIENDMVLPVKMYTNILSELEKSLTVSENYILLTKWKLTVAITQLVSKLNSKSKDWESIFKEIAPEFGQICLDNLKQDVKLHFPCIYTLFSKALNRMTETIIPDGAKLQICKSILSDADFVQGYLTSIELSANEYACNQSKYEDLWKLISSHPSVEVKMHCYNRNRRERRYFS